MDYKDYLKKIKKEKIIITLGRLLIFILIILIWQLYQEKNTVNSFILSSPLKIIKTIINLYKQNNLFKHIIITIKETLIAFTITSLLSLFIAMILYTYNILAKIVEPYLTIINSIPKVSLGPIIILLFGANTKSIIIMAILISIFVSIQNILNGFNQTDKLKIKLLNTFNSTKKDILFLLIIPYNKKTILNTFKINISMCLIGVISGEFLTSKMGIGYLILYGSQVFNLDLVMSGLILLLIISVIMYIIISNIIKE